MRSNLIGYAWMLSCTVAVGGLFSTSCAQSGGTAAPTAALARVPSSSTTAAEYGIVQWLATTEDHKITWTGYDTTGTAVAGVTVTSTPLSAGEYQLTLGVIDGVPGQVTILVNAEGKRTVVGNPNLTAAQARLAVRAVTDLYTYNSGTSGAASIDPAVAEGLRALGVGADGCKTGDLVGAAVDGLLCIAGGAVTGASVAADLATLGAATPLTWISGALTGAGCIRAGQSIGNTISACTTPGADAGKGTDSGSSTSDTGSSSDAGAGSDGGGGAASDGGAGSDGGGAGSDGGGGGGSEGGYAFIERPSTDRHHLFQLTPGETTVIPFTWNDVSGVAAPADLWVESEGRTVLQVASEGDHPFARAGLDVVALEAGQTYRLVLSRSAGSVRVMLSSASRDAMLDVQVPTDARVDDAPLATDIVLPSKGLLRSSIVADLR